MTRRTSGIVVIRAGAVGDTLMVTPLVRALRRAFPDAYLGFICSRSAYDVLRYNPHLDEVIPLVHRHVPMWLSTQKRRIARQLTDAQLDAVSSLESHSDFTKLACRIGAARIITYDASRQSKNLEHLAPDSQEHSIERHLRAGAKLGSSWPAKRFAQIVESLERFGGRVVLTGSAVDRPLTEFIAGAAKVPMINLAGRLSLLELGALIRRMDLYITVDSGPGPHCRRTRHAFDNSLGPGNHPGYGAAVGCRAGAHSLFAPSLRSMLRHSVGQAVYG